jgi:hypothetical protein
VVLDVKIEGCSLIHAMIMLHENQIISFQAMALHQQNHAWTLLKVIGPCLCVVGSSPNVLMTVRTLLVTTTTLITVNFFFFLKVCARV